MIVSVKSNWKGASASTPWEVFLGNSTLITGPNGSGKSRMVESIELALTGQVSNYLGRGTVRDPKMLWRAKPKGKGALFVELTLTDGRVIRWEQARSNGKPTRTIDGEIWSGNGLGSVFGVAEVRANLFGSPKKAEKWLSGKLGLTLDDVFSQLEEKLGAEVFTFAESLRATAPYSDIDSFLGMLKSGARDCKAKARAAQALVEELEHISGTYVSDTELAEAKEASLVAAREVGKAQGLQEAITQLQEAHGEYQRAGMELASIAAPDGPQNGIICARSLSETLKQVLRHYPASQDCPCCGKGLDNGADTLRTRLAGLTQFIEAADESTKLANRRTVLETSLRQAKARGEHLMGLIPPQMLPTAESNPVAGVVEAAEGRLARAYTRLDELQRRRVSSQSPGMAQTTVEQESSKANLYQTTADCLEGVVAEKVATTLESFNRALKSGYPDHFGTPVLALRPQVAVSLERGGVSGVPSGGEEALLLFAIAGVLAYLQSESNAGSINVIVMEDRGLDGDTLNSLLPMWKDCEYAQILVPTTTKASGDTEGWEVLSYWPTESEDKPVVVRGTGNKVDPFTLAAPLSH